MEAGHAILSALDVFKIVFLTKCEKSFVGIQGATKLNMYMTLLCLEELSAFFDHTKPMEVVFFPPAINKPQGLSNSRTFRGLYLQTRLSTFRFFDFQKVQEKNDHENQNAKQTGKPGSELES